MDLLLSENLTAFVVGQFGGRSAVGPFRVRFAVGRFVCASLSVRLVSASLLSHRSNINMTRHGRGACHCHEEGLLLCALLVLVVESFP